MAVHGGKAAGPLPMRYFLLVFGLSVPFWLIGALAARAGVGLPFNLPLSALMLVCPVVAAAILTYRHDGPAGVRTLLRRTFDVRRIGRKIWYAPMLLTIPVIYLLSHAALRMMGRDVRPPTAWAWAAIPLLAVVFFVLSAAEELGWMGYAFGPLQQRWGALGAALLLGLVWAVWHVIPDLQAHHTAQWIAAQRLYTIALRVVIVWVSVNSGHSVFAAIAVHTTEDLSYALTSSYYDPTVTAAMTTAVAAVVTVLWGPQTLARFRLSPTSVPK